MPYGVLLIAEGGVIAYANDTATRVAGVGIDAIHATNVQELFRGAAQADGAALPWRRHPVAVAWRTGEAVRGTAIRLPPRGGGACWLLLDAAPVAGEGDSRPHVLATFVDISARVREEEAQRLRGGYLAALQDMTRALVRRLDPAELLELLVTAAAAVLRSKSGALLLAQTGGDELAVMAGTGIHGDRIGARVRRGDGLMGRVWAGGQPQVVNDYQEWEHRLPGHHTLNACAAVPIVVEGDVLGVLCVSQSQPGQRFAPDELTVLAQFSVLAAMAVADIRRRQTETGRDA